MSRTQNHFVLKPNLEWQRTVLWVCFTSQSKFSFAMEGQKESSSAYLFSRCGPLNARPNRVSQNFIVHFNFKVNFHWIISYNNNKSCSYRRYRRLHLAKCSWQNLIWTEEVLLCQPTPIFMTYRRIEGSVCLLNFWLKNKQSRSAVHFWSLFTLQHWMIANIFIVQVPLGETRK